MAIWTWNRVPSYFFLRVSDCKVWGLMFINKKKRKKNIETRLVKRAGPKKKRPIWIPIRCVSRALLALFVECVTPTRVLGRFRIPNTISSAVDVVVSTSGRCGNGKVNTREQRQRNSASSEPDRSGNAVKTKTRVWG